MGLLVYVQIGEVVGLFGAVHVQLQQLQASHSACVQYKYLPMLCCAGTSTCWCSTAVCTAVSLPKCA
jgi:hypothetical protein